MCDQACASFRKPIRIYYRCNWGKQAFSYLYRWQFMVVCLWMLICDLYYKLLSSLLSIVSHLFGTKMLFILLWQLRLQKEVDIQIWHRVSRLNSCWQKRLDLLLFKFHVTKEKCREKKATSLHKIKRERERVRERQRQRETGKKENIESRLTFVMATMSVGHTGIIRLYQCYIAVCRSTTVERLVKCISNGMLHRLE